MDLLLQSPQCAFALCVLCFSHVSICAFVGLRVRVCLFLCSYTSVVINVVYLIGLSPPPVLWAVMKLNTVHFIFERSLSKHILSSVLQLALSCIDRALSGNCSLFVSGALILFFLNLFFLWCVCLCVCSSSFAFLPLTHSFRNPNLNASCCGFLQKLSMCLLSQSDLPSGSHQHGMQIHARLHHTQRHAVRVKTMLLLSASEQWCHAASFLRNIELSLQFFQIG